MVHDFPVAPELLRLPHDLIAFDLGIPVVEVGIGGDVDGCPGGHLVAEDVPVSAAARLRVVALPHHVVPRHLGRVVVVRVIRDLGERVRFDLVEEDLVVAAVVAPPDHV